MFMYSHFLYKGIKEGQAVEVQICSLYPGCVSSAEMLTAVFLTSDPYKSGMEGRSALMILLIDLIVHCKLDLSCSVDEPSQTPQ